MIVIWLLYSTILTNKRNFYIKRIIHTKVKFVNVIVFWGDLDRNPGIQECPIAIDCQFEVAIFHFFYGKWETIEGNKNFFFFGRWQTINPAKILWIFFFSIRWWRKKEWRICMIDAYVQMNRGRIFRKNIHDRNFEKWRS